MPLLESETAIRVTIHPEQASSYTPLQYLSTRRLDWLQLPLRLLYDAQSAQYCLKSDISNCKTNTLGRLYGCSLHLGYSWFILESSGAGYVVLCRRVVRVVSGRSTVALPMFNSSFLERYLGICCRTNYCCFGLQGSYLEGVQTIKYKSLTTSIRNVTLLQTMELDGRG